MALTVPPGHKRCRCRRLARNIKHWAWARSAASAVIAPNMNAASYFPPAAAMIWSANRILRGSFWCWSKTMSIGWFPKGYYMPWQRSAPKALCCPIASARAEIRARRIETYHFHPIQQQNEAHTIEPRVRPVAVTTEYVEVGPSLALSAHRSMNMPAASTMRRHRSSEKPGAGAIEHSAAYPSAHRRGTLAPD